MRPGRPVRLGPRDDLDPIVLRELKRPNLEIRAHDVLVDELPEGEFDLGHVRLLLAWLADPAEALRRLVAALRPGGWLVAEEMDFVSAVGVASRATWPPPVSSR